MDLVYLGAVILFFLLAWGLLKLCEVLMRGAS